MNPTRPRRLRRALAVVAGLVAASVILSGCLSAMIPDASPRPSSSKAADTDGVAENLLPYYEQPLDWSSCNETFDCATVTAPLDWSDPTKGDIELSIIRSRAEGTDDPIGSLLTNPGGPGASGVDLIRDSVSFAVSEPVRRQFDVIGFDPRGVGESTAVTCYDAADMDAYLFDIPEGARGTDAWADELLARHKSFGEACDENSDGILPYITTENSARDMDLLRAVLGDTELNYLGYSYGTFLGATYAKLFPEKAGRLVLDGAVDPSVSNLDVNVTQGTGFESALRAYMADCLTDKECPFRGTVDEAMADLGTLLASVDRDPIPNADGRLLGSDSLMTAIVAALYSQDSWGYLTMALTDVLQGNADIAFQLADFYYDRQGGTYTGNQTEAFRAYNCMDYPTGATDEDLAAAEATLAEKAPTIAPYWFGPDPCEVWPYPPTGVRERITADGAAPIVVVGTTNDPATPYEWSVSLADQLSSGVLVTRVGEGHTGYNKGNSCVDSAIETYLLEGTPPQDGLRCE
ncbi:pimeloyl-ACP methyl ester carboxylesterase [Microbacterium trichothecenolyticum]|uniref:alpha/beta hydrolase n=1 Tax=Microbacterium trichothecenolyticum TaxID=69370 RepID=UPI00285627FA|nr:alpha/beta hydrolase [Microbacterium trichothecenolyticum]MDR7111278.1 pimeloyl-ACP methyl ester carboxylesterase [Microbacterium trichothecenolyticum]